MKRINKSILKRRITTAFELPKDIMLDLPSINIIGDEELVLVGHKGIIEYTDEHVRIKTTIGIVKVYGQKMLLKEVSKENIVVAGKIREVKIT